MAAATAQRGRRLQFTDDVPLVERSAAVTGKPSTPALPVHSCAIDVIGHDSGAFGRGDEEARAGPAREKALGDEAVVGFDHGDPRDIVVGNCIVPFSLSLNGNARRCSLH